MKKIILVSMLVLFLFIVGCSEEDLKELEESLGEVEKSMEELDQATKTTETKEQPQETKEKSSLEKLKESLEESKQKLSELDKVDECTKVCSGEYYDIPAVRDEMYASCYEAYYYGGEEVLDEFIKGCGG